jgi:hypothetical protein
LRVGAFIIIARRHSYGSFFATHRDYARDAQAAIAHHQPDEAHWALKLFWLAAV